MKLIGLKIMNNEQSGCVIWVHMVQTIPLLTAHRPMSNFMNHLLHIIEPVELFATIVHTLGQQL